MERVWPECTTRCRSLQHALDVISVVTRGSEQQIKIFLSSYCCNATTLKDTFGRNVTHIAASCGKKNVLDWLVTEKGVDLSVKDKESGWTALHRSIFYGHIDCALSLLKHGSNLYIQDKDGYTPLDVVMKDRPPHIIFKTSDPTEVYTWGDNVNFTLGHGTQQSKHHPELLETFPRSGVYIKQVVLCKFHSVFLSQKGQVYTCGHGQGGRLGHGDELTCLVPRLVEGLSTHPCAQVAAAKDHTVVLSEDGYVYTFGLNTFHQLGIQPPPPNSNVPKQVQAKTMKGKTVLGVAAGRFHTVLWTKDAVYTVGLNGGQLGYLQDPNGEKCVSCPRQVSALHHKDINITLVSASDGATVCVSERGDIYLLSEYQCKKLASKQLNLKKVLVSGGFLEYKAAPEHLKDNGGQPACVLALDQAGRVFCWKSPGSSLKQCRWVYGRQVFMSDVALNKHEIMFVTQDGEGFTGKWMLEKKKKENTISSIMCHFDPQNLFERINLQKLPFVHRAVSVATDPSGCNFAVLQSDPKTSLFQVPSVSSSVFAEDFENFLNEVNETDSIHDVTFQVGTKIFPVHKYILALRSDFFGKLFSSGEINCLDFPEVHQKGEDAAGCDLFVIEKIPPELFEYVLQFIYFDSCDMLLQGHKPKLRHKEENEDTILPTFQKMGFHEEIKGKSAYEVYKNSRISAENEKQKGKTKQSKKTKSICDETSPVKLLQNTAKKFGLTNLISRLDGVRYENGRINVFQKKSGDKLRFNQEKCSSLYDVMMKSEDGKEFHCHKCVLCARLEYFNSMLSSSWIEATCCSKLQMPIHSDVLQVILDYIYTDEALAVKESANVEFICNVLVMADQLLIVRLKEICEVTIAERITLKNAAELLEIAALYNADQLKLSCLQFIVLNMGALLEARSLDVLSDDVLKDLSEAYRKMIPPMNKRIITPYLDGPDVSILQSEDIKSLVSVQDDIYSYQNTQEAAFKKSKAKAKKKPRKRLDSSGGYNLSDIIHSSPSTGFVKPEKTNSVESLQDLLTSDSEGSFVGASSPRDLQSPDFFPTFTPEAKETICVEINGSSPPVTNRAASKKKPKPTPSSPEVIPSSRITPSSSPNWVAMPFSPSSPVAVDLRAIMELEENKQKCGAMPKLNSGGPKPVAHGMKLSQKQRKMMAMSSKESNNDNKPAIITATASIKSPAKTWAAAFHFGECKSFRELLLEENQSVISFPSLGSDVKKTKHTEELDPPEPARLSGSISHEAKLKCDVPNQDSSNPWHLTLSKNTSSSAPVTFTAIVEEEEKQEAALIRSREKPLALIQIEERAIQDLLIHYQALDNPEEYITVERAAQTPMATPMWNKH
ncbi:hypothetical protein XENTR_v10014218 [Xenopus tropicalis]|uniref:Inhibitor of Bruton tyrosine kinase n=1 Tax=Xenopus tropicalis TaxID=8364 RepID=F6YPM5_XENTR|nr:inhibitor of Bruton tyrosine kinase [Xenopus tropicalis]XP_031757997.1 inhibitor of Bruton tyrosine kinase [Xenopus tropicalis]XP_031757998.1 inhibitor of Bruton tyrosine kinase [Xenopus tropicalis]XP_031757999.1 inhibitor of Bruton tyrosine kinase [Xenopus tropicalis]KAE8603105.1 hypothetical protein XENTR_v10014218 [Xenopus tropicalis]KAE8603106.1 hypothetical protein XENTR_v10014218 [Xenopus tropicalis]KAE8603107.1 hypothetical protein XENTR_v10014218 [Xenopus tropicalis]